MPRCAATSGLHHASGSPQASRPGLRRFLVRPNVMNAVLREIQRTECVLRKSAVCGCGVTKKRTLAVGPGPSQSASFRDTRKLISSHSLPARGNISALVSDRNGAGEAPAHGAPAYLRSIPWLCRDAGVSHSRLPPCGTSVSCCWEYREASSLSAHPPAQASGSFA